MELCCQHICFSSLKFWRSSWYFRPGVDAYEYILGSIKVNLPPQLCWTTHSSRKIPTTKYDTKYWKYPQRNVTQNTEYTYNEIWHKKRKHGKYLQGDMTKSYFLKTSVPADTRSFQQYDVFVLKPTFLIASPPYLKPRTTCEEDSLKIKIPHIWSKIT